ncbi:LacI family transcriptional regulator [Arthrobacter sp. Leaf234]|uniref:LacI family DNA-binding transcriptional regulator n=1 Tax=Arthrobacter sp. Leaf234 TaxID=1736303 RepID=UPI0006F84F38|nr:LacI family DNA-binding transcriptional regulator [Arthrobacter sp. Leaf234]KQO03282.1 LacI family transcriptional regulator [Arthrobacter sp. Leaf234]
MSVTSIRGSKRPTIDDVAKAAGVSRGTVSRVLNGGHWVSPDALTAVEIAIKKTGYRINPHARSLATSKANTVAFLLSETQERLFEDPNFSILMRGASEALGEHDVSLVLIMAGTKDEQRRARDFITAGHVDGVLLVSSHARGQSIVGEIHRSGVPMIACGIPLGFEGKIGYVAADDATGARDMVAYLRGLGRTGIATITGPMDTSGGVGRLRGYREQMGSDFDENLTAAGDYSRDSGRRAMRQLLDQAPDLDAVFAANDLMAAGALDVLRAAGKRVPEDVAVAGFDDSPVAASTEPQLTTMRQPFLRISHEMVRILLGVIRGDDPAAMILPTHLVERASTKPSSAGLTVGT